jgi:hypothetical protein
MTKVGADSDNGFYFMTAYEGRWKNLGWHELSDEEIADYLRVSEEFNAWQTKLAKISDEYIPPTELTLVDAGYGPFTKR